MSRRVFLTGASGFVGGNIGRVFAEAHGAELTCPTRSAEGPSGFDWGWTQLDLTDRERTIEAVEAASPDAIVHCAILNDLDRMYGNRREAWESYVGSTRNLVDAADQTGARIVLVSTDWVFDGTGHLATEDEPPNPINYYGVLKQASEMVVTERATRGSVARISAVNGAHWTQPDNPRSQDAGFGYFLASVVDALERGERFRVWDGEGINETATPSLASDSAERIWRIIDRDLDGIFHCCGEGAIDRLELARRTAAAFGLDPAMVETGSPPPEALPSVPVPVDTSLSAVETADRIGLPALTVDEILSRFRRERETGEIVPAGGAT